MQQVTDRYIREFVRTLSLKDRAKRENFDIRFYRHVYNVEDFRSRANAPHLDNFGIKEYQSTTQFALENSALIEPKTPQEIDWDVLDNARDYLSERLKEQLGHERNSDTLKPVIRFTIDTYETYLQYKMMHPNSSNNLWVPTFEILDNGYVFLISNNNDIISEYDIFTYKNEWQKEIPPNAISFIAKAKEDKQFKRLSFDKHLTIKEEVCDYLNGNNGEKKAYTKGEILKYLTSKEFKVTPKQLNQIVLKPLREMGIIDSSSKGYYFINSKEDIQRAYNRHHTEYISAKKKMKFYEKKATDLGIMLQTH